MKLCGKEDCIYKAIEDMVNKMKEHIAKTQNIPYDDQIVVAKIYDLNTAVLSEACRRESGVAKDDCDPSRQFKLKNLSMDTFILLNQLKEDGFITEERKNTIFNALLKINPDMKEIIEKDRSGLI
jgi:hypothetical protein